MGLAIALYLLVLAAAISRAVYRQYARGEAELVSFRNIAVLGFIYFHLWSGTYPMVTGDTLGYPVEDLNMTGLKYAAMATVFSIVFWIAYKRGWGAHWLAEKVPTSSVHPSEPILWAVAVALLPLAMAMKFSVQVPLIGILTGYAANSLAALSAGIGGWIWARRFFNPFVACMAGSLFLAASFVGTIGEFGRRPLVGVALCMIWGMYFSIWRCQRLMRWAPRLALLGAVGLIMVISYSSIRARRGVTDSFSSLVSGLSAGANISKGAESMIFSDSAPVSLWLIATHPDIYEPRPLFTLYYTFLNPVPRQWWPEKPTTLGLLAADMAKKRNVAKEFNLGPGILGHAGAEGGWYALVIYAICGGLLLKFFDRLAQRGLRNPLIMLPLGSTLGQVLAMARGETSLFVFTFVYGTAATYAGMLLFLWIARSMGIGAGAPALEEDCPEENEVVTIHTQSDGDRQEWSEYDSRYDERNTPAS